METRTGSSPVTRTKRIPITVSSFCFFLKLYKCGAVMNTYKSQLYDNIHSVINFYNDRMVRGIFEYNFSVNTNILTEVIDSFINDFPVMHSSFHRGFFNHIWKEHIVTAEDIIEIHYTDNPSEDAFGFILNVLPMDGKVQIKLGVFTNGNKTAIAVITNHMYMDGGDLKRFMSSLCRAYNLRHNGESISGILKSGSRSYNTVYNDFSPKIRRKAKRLFSNPTPKNTKIFPLSAESESDKSFIITRTIPKSKFDPIKGYGKQYNATINDMILTAYFISLYELGGFDKNEKITVSGAINLRRYMKDTNQTGLTNHSSYIPYTLNGLGEDFLHTLEKVTVLSKAYKKDPFTGLYGLPLLNFGYKFFPSIVSDKLVKKFYNNPNIAISNIGILQEDSYILDEFAPENAFLTGTVKYKPGIMVSLTTYKNQITLSMCCKGNEKDKDKLNELLMLIEEKLIDAIENHPEDS